MKDIPLRSVAIFLIALALLFGGFGAAAQFNDSACASKPPIQPPTPSGGYVSLALQLDCLTRKVQRLEQENGLARAALANIALQDSAHAKPAPVPETLPGSGGKSGVGFFDGMGFKDWLSVLASVFGFVVVPFTLVGIWRSRVVSQVADNWKSRQEEIGTYNDINSKYSEFLQILLANPDVDIGEFETPRPLKTDAEKYKRMTMYAILVVLMERAFLLYTAIDKFDADLQKGKLQKTWLVAVLDRVEEFLFGKHPVGYETHIFKTQWPGWIKYFEYYCSHEAFQEYWKSTVTGEASGVATMWQDASFEEFVNERIAKATGSDLNSLRSK